MNEIPINEVDACWPRGERVILVTSVDEAGSPNIIAVGWTMRCNSNPPAFAICLGKKSHSCQNITRSEEFVIGIPGWAVTLVIIGILTSIIFGVVSIITKWRA